VSVNVYQTFPPLVQMHGTVGPSCVEPALVPITTASPLPNVSGVALARSSLAGRHEPPEQLEPDVQAVPHAPQFELSVVGLMHTPPQFI
jgi:hypothetical protein